MADPTNGSSRGRKKALACQRPGRVFIVAMVTDKTIRRASRRRRFLVLPTTSSMSTSSSAVCCLRRRDVFRPRSIGEAWAEPGTRVERQARPTRWPREAGA